MNDYNKSEWKTCLETTTLVFLQLSAIQNFFAAASNTCGDLSVRRGRDMCLPWEISQHKYAFFNTVFVASDILCGGGINHHLSFQPCASCHRRLVMLPFWLPWWSWSVPSFCWHDIPTPWWTPAVQTQCQHLNIFRRHHHCLLTIWRWLLYCWWMLSFSHHNF